MCGLCPDTLGSCAEIECGARSPIDENGKRRWFYMKHFTSMVKTLASMWSKVTTRIALFAPATPAIVTTTTRTTNLSTTIPVIDAAKAIELLTAVVEESGKHFVYEVPQYEVTKDSPLSSPLSCLYAYKGQPSCLVARALVKHGVPLDFLVQHEGLPIKTLWEEVHMPWLTSEAAEVLDIAQAYQDSMRPYGEALSEAIRQAKMLGCDI